MLAPAKAMTEAEKAEALTELFALADPDQFDGDDPFDGVAGGAVGIISRLTNSADVTVAMVPTGANPWGFNKLGQLVARAELDIEDTLKMNNWVEYGFQDEMHGAYLKGIATVHSVKRAQAQGSATKTTTTASGSKARRLPNDEEATTILAETGASWREVVATQVATAIGTVPDAFEIDAMGYGSNPYNSDPAKFMKKQGRTSASDLMLRKDHQGLYDLHQQMAEELISSGYHVMGARLMQLTMQLSRVTIAAGYPQGYSTYWEAWHAGSKTMPLPANLDQGIMIMKVLGQKNGDGDSSFKRIEAKYQANAEDLKREVDELKKRVGRLGNQPPGHSNDDNNACWKCGSTVHKAWQCTLTKEEGVEAKKKKREAEKKKSEEEAAASSA